MTRTEDVGLRTNQEQKYFAHISHLALGQYHHNIGSTTWNRCMARPITNAFETFWNHEFIDEPIYRAQSTGEYIRS
jgi:catechol-2,3-dioxygenase